MIKEKDFSNISDLEKNPFLNFEHRYYLFLSLLGNILIAFFFSFLFATPIVESILVLFFARVVFVWHMTWFINSIAHMYGKKTFNKEISARDNHLIAILTHGEGYHNFHHSFPGDFRNGYSIFSFDLSKWILLSCNFLGLVSNLRRTDEKLIKVNQKY